MAPFAARGKEAFPTSSAAQVGRSTDLWESVIKHLDSLGLVDTGRVGIIGFSRLVGTRALR